MASIVFFLALLLLLPVKIRIRYKDGFEFSVKYLFITYKPGGRIGKEEEDDGESTPLGAVKGLRRASKEGEMSPVALFVEIAKILVSFSKRLLSHTLVDKIYLRLTVATGDAARTAIDYGAACAAAYPALGMLAGLIKVRKHDVEIMPDFDGEKTSGELDFILRVRLVFALYAAVLALIRFVRFSALSKLKAGAGSN